MRISSFGRVLGLAPFVGAGLLFCARDARATSVTEFPDNGSEQMGRGGAWVARASDPLAAFYNPAGLAGQDTRVLVDANINISKTCFTRVKATNDATKDGVLPGATYPQVCNDAKPFPNPQLAFAYRLTPRIGIGFAVLGPSASGKQNWPEDAAAPNRYLLTKADALFFTPTLGAGFEVANGLRLGASFQWGVANVKFSNRSNALNVGNVTQPGTGQTPTANDVDATLSAKTMFVPGFTLGALWSATDTFDLAAWYKWSAPIDAKGDVTTLYGKKSGDTSVANCGDVDNPTQTTCGSGNNAHVKVPVPMEAKIGARFHQRRAGAITPHRRDPMSEDVFDVEADLTWANNSSFDNLEVRFPGNPDGSGVINVPGLPGPLPPNADVKHHYKDVVGVRVGGDVNVLPDQLALRAGAYVETSAQDKQYQNIDFPGGSRVGLALGATYRLRFRKDDPEKKSALEFSLGFGHTFVAEQNNTDPNAAGVPALAGTACNPAANAASGPNCVDPATGQVTGLKYRTNWPVNLGTITSSFNMFNVGVAYRF